MKKFYVLFALLSLHSPQKIIPKTVIDQNNIKYEIQPIDYHSFGGFVIKDSFCKIYPITNPRLFSTVYLKIKNNGNKTIKLNSTSPLNGLINFHADKVLEVEDKLAAIFTSIVTSFVGSYISTNNYMDNDNLKTYIISMISTFIISTGIALAQYHITRFLHGDFEIPKDLKPDEQIEYVVKVFRRSMNKILNQKLTPSLDYEVLKKENTEIVTTN